MSYIVNHPDWRDDITYTLATIKEWMRDNEVNELKAFKAVPTSDPYYMYCTRFDEIGEKGNCGKFCEAYAPRNGKSGACRHLGKLYDEGEEVIIRIK